MSSFEDPARETPARDDAPGPLHADVRLGRIAGVEIGVNRTWLIVFALITWTLATNVFPASNEGLSTGEYVAMALVATLLYFGSLLVHELAHAVQARREGMRVSGITLWVFGGVARFDGMFPSAGAELRVAAAGPLATLVLGFAFIGAAKLLALPAPVDAVLAWLGVMNLFLFAFNMLPAMPLDGGRVLHAILWKLRGSLSWATQVAGRIGQAFGVLMVAGGALIALDGDVASGVWLALIGWFVAAAAAGEVRMGAARDALRGLHVSDVMVWDPVTLPAGARLRDAVDRVIAHTGYTAYPVTDDGDAVGLLASTGVTSLPGEALDELRVRDRMIPAARALTVTPEDDLPDAAAALAQTDLGRALVVRDRRLVGLLSITDVRRALALRERAMAHR